MKTNYFKLSSLLLLSFLVGCGKPAKESDPTPGVLQQNSAASEEQKQTDEEIKKKIEENDVNGLRKVITENQVDLTETKVGEDTPLIAAIKSNSAAVIEYLLQKGANPEETNSKGETPLMVAVANNNLGTVSLLLQKKVKIDKKNIEGDTALHIAIKKGLEDLALLLVRHGANIRVTDKDNIAPDELAKDMNLNKLHDTLVKLLQVSIAAPDLHTYRSTIVNGDLKTLSLILGDYEGIAQTYESINPLGLILELEQKKENDAQQMIHLLLTNKKPVSVNGPKTADYAPLIQAAMHKKMVFVNLLLEYRADPNRVDREGRSALVHAIGHNNLEMVDALLDHKASKKYTVVRESDKKKVTFEGCDVARAVGKKTKDAEGKKINKAIKEKLDCGFWEWLL